MTLSLSKTVPRTDESTHNFPHSGKLQLLGETSGWRQDAGEGPKSPSSLLKFRPIVSSHI